MNKRKGYRVVTSEIKYRYCKRCGKRLIPSFEYLICKWCKKNGVFGYNEKYSFD